MALGFGASDIFRQASIARAALPVDRGDLVEAAAVGSEDLAARRKLAARSAERWGDLLGLEEDSGGGIRAGPGRKNRARQ